MSEVKGFAGSVLSGATRTLKITHGSGADGPNEALAVEYPHLVEIYTKAGRAAELRYVQPDTSGLIAQCRAK